MKMMSWYWRDSKSIENQLFEDNKNLLMKAHIK